jgi:hypothetical protein
MDMHNDQNRHMITFKETTEPDGFRTIDPSDEELWTDTPWQFAVPGVRGEPSGVWRVHGFITEEMFHIVWLDPQHRLYPLNGE